MTRVVSWLFKSRRCRCCFFLLLLTNALLLLLLLLLLRTHPLLPRGHHDDDHSSQGVDVFGLRLRHGNDNRTSGEQQQAKATAGLPLTHVAIGLAVTSKHLPPVVAPGDVRYTLPVFRSLLPSLCKTSSQGVHYHLYLAHDRHDAFFSNTTTRGWFMSTFATLRQEMCSYVTRISCHLIACNHDNRPAWAQNDAMFEAYLDGADYFYRVNDDTWLKTPGWTERFITALAQMDPPNVGVVGPRQEGGKTSILTYDFVHRSHLDIFGFYYPRAFTDWWGDDWITSVYMPGRSKKILDIKVVHTQQFGTRYMNQFERVQFLAAETDHGKQMLYRYIEALRDNTTIPNTTYSNLPKRKTVNLASDQNITQNESKPSSKLVISMSIYGTFKSQIYGAMRNSVLRRIYFPTWGLQVYMEDPNGVSVYETVDPRVVQKLRDLGAEIHFVNPVTAERIRPELWSLLVIEDARVDRFIVREADTRLSGREARAVRSWMESSSSTVHCVRDHVTVAWDRLPHGLWGAEGSILRTRLKEPIRASLEAFSLENTGTTMERGFSVSSKSEPAVIRLTGHSMATTVIASDRQSLNTSVLPNSQPHSFQMDKPMANSRQHSISGNTSVHSPEIAATTSLHTTLSHQEISNFLKMTVWSQLGSGDLLCHDSQGCLAGDGDGGAGLVEDFPRDPGHEYVGQKYDEWGTPTDASRNDTHVRQC